MDTEVDSGHARTVRDGAKRSPVALSDLLLAVVRALAIVPLAILPLQVVVLLLVRLGPVLLTILLAVLSQVLAADLLSLALTGRSRIGQGGSIDRPGGARGSDNPRLACLGG